MPRSNLLCRLGLCSLLALPALAWTSPDAQGDTKYRPARKVPLAPVGERERAALVAKAQRTSQENLKRGQEEMRRVQRLLATRSTDARTMVEAEHRRRGVPRDSASATRDEQIAALKKVAAASSHLTEARQLMQRDLTATPILPGAVVAVQQDLGITLAASSSAKGAKVGDASAPSGQGSAALIQSVIPAEEFDIRGGEAAGMFADGAWATSVGLPSASATPTILGGVNTDKTPGGFGRANEVSMHQWMGACRALPSGYRRIAISASPRLARWSALVSYGASAMTSANLRLEVITAGGSSEDSIQLTMHALESAGLSVTSTPTAPPGPIAGLYALLGVVTTANPLQALFEGTPLRAWPVAPADAWPSRDAALVREISPDGENVMIRYSLELFAESDLGTQAVAHARLAAADVHITLIP